MMRKERTSALIGILAVVILAVGFICCCRVQNKIPLEKRYQDVAEEEPKEGAETLAQKGYIVYQPLSEAVQKLIDTNIFYTPDNMFYEEEEYGGYDDYTKEEMEQEKEEQKKTYEDELEKLKQIGTAEYLENTGVTIVTESWDFDFRGMLKYDSKTNRFTDSEKIATIENCGFPEFSALMSEIEKKTETEVQWNLQNGEEGWYYTYYSVYYPGVVFLLRRCTTEAFMVELKINYSDNYIPEKYRGVIDGVTNGGRYFLYSSCVGGDREMLVFCRNHSIHQDNWYSDGMEAGKYDENKLLFIFEDGKLVDYYVTTSSKELKLDDADKQILNAYTKGTGKELSGKAVKYNGIRIYKAD